MMIQTMKMIIQLLQNEEHNFLSQYHLLNPNDSNNICNITPVIKNANLIPCGLFLLLSLILLIDKLNIIVPITKLIIPTKKDCINISIIIIRKKILLIKYLKYLINNNYEQLGMG